MTISIVRHGESTANRDVIIQGQSDFPLTDRGCEEAARIAEWFDEQPVNLVYSSEQLRATQTADVLCKRRNLPLHTDPRLNAFDTGLFTARAKADLTPEELTLFPKVFGLSDSREHGGENFADICDRAAHFIAEVRAQYTDEHMVIFTHHYTKRALCAALLGLTRDDLRDLKFGNTAVSSFTVTKKGAEAIVLNSLDHLDSAAPTMETLSKFFQ